MFTAITTWLTATLFPILVNFVLTFILTEVILALIMNISSSFFVDVVIDGGFLRFNEIDTWIGKLIGMQGLEISEAIMIIAGVVLAINIVVEGIKIFMSPITNNEISPSAFFSRCIVTIILFLLYPTICDFVGEFLNAAIKLPIFDISNLKEAFKEARTQTVGIKFFGTLADGGITGLLVCIVISTIMIKDIIFAGIIYVERYLSFALYMLLGPICIAFHPNSTQKDMTRAWLKGIVSQIIVILLSIFALNLFCSQLINLSSENALGDNKIAKLIVSIALLELVKNSEQLVNMLGLSTIPSGDTARMFLGGVAAAGVAVSKANKLRKGGADVLRKGNEKMHGAQGSKSTMVSTGLSKAGGMQTKEKMEENLGKGIVDNLRQKLGRVPTAQEINDVTSGVTGNYGKLTPLKRMRDDLFGGNKYKTEFGCSMPMDSKENILKSANEYANNLKKENATLATKTPTSQAILNAKKDPTGLKGVGNATELKFDGSKGFSKNNPNDDGNYYRGFRYATKKEGQNDNEARVGYSYSYGHLENGQWVTAKDPNAKENIAKLDNMQKTYEVSDPNERSILRMSKDFKDKEQQVMKDVLRQGVTKDGVTSSYDFNNEKDKVAFKENYDKIAKERGLYDTVFDAPMNNVLCSEDPEGGIKLVGNKTISGEENVTSALGLKTNEYGADQLVETQRYNPDKGRCEVVTDMYKTKLDNNGEPITKYTDDGNGGIKQATEVNKLFSSSDLSGDTLLEKGDMMQTSMQKFENALKDNIKEISADKGKMINLDNKEEYDDLLFKTKMQVPASDHPFSYNDSDYKTFVDSAMNNVVNNPSEIFDVLNRSNDKGTMSSLINDLDYNPGEVANVLSKSNNEETASSIIRDLEGSKGAKFVDEIYTAPNTSKEVKNEIESFYAERAVANLQDKEIESDLDKLLDPAYEKIAATAAIELNEQKIDSDIDKLLDSLVGGNKNTKPSLEDLNINVETTMTQNNSSNDTLNHSSDDKQKTPTIQRVLSEEALQDEPEDQWANDKEPSSKDEKEKKSFFGRKKKK